jgi:hypothetical protein
VSEAAACLAGNEKQRVEMGVMDRVDEAEKNEVPIKEHLRPLQVGPQHEPYPS